MNRDTLYSSFIVDINNGAILTMPDADLRKPDIFVSLSGDTWAKLYLSQATPDELIESGVLEVAGARRAANSIEDLKDGASRVTRRGGFRYLIAKRYSFEMEMDIARDPEDTVFYIQGGTAWC